MRLSVLPRMVLDGALVLLLLLTGWRVLESHAWTSIVGSKNFEVIPSVRRGDIVHISGLNWSADRTVVLIVSTTCPACNASTPFYQELVALATSNLDVVAVAAEPRDIVAAWLRTKGVPLTRVYRANELKSLGFHMTPILLIVDAAGRVTDIMMRKLQPSDEQRVVNRLRRLSADPLDNSQQLHEFSLDDISHLQNLRLIDVRSRERFEAGHRQGARNIPVAELSGRAQIELSQKDPIVVDCLYPGSGGCRAAAWSLITQGFTDVGVLINR